MLQRPQTVLLLIAVLLLIGFNFLSICSYKQGDTTYTLYGWYCQEVQDNNLLVRSYFPFMCIGLLAATSGMMSMYAIVRYDHRKLQRKLCLGSIFALMLCLLLMIFLPPYAALADHTDVTTQWHIGFAFPAVALLLTRTAMRFIQRDEDLVNSVDRLR